ncbi:hypothetical protein Acor_68100 [Acrocarpospora corrugata]|uniref:Uncharacterized protein n=1 Tax=Acrocarpospora corrugata TaxID=35763 RepID=A0A5M3W9Q2_9ACTN|nr:hypothetical protein [Acrocarpospora corrugata]GES04742.1 hypothetical protein Acor_68100 [Acrocarpospora corrugata]
MPFTQYATVRPVPTDSSKDLLTDVSTRLAAELGDAPGVLG